MLDPISQYSHINLSIHRLDYTAKRVYFPSEKSAKNWHAKKLEWTDIKFSIWSGRISVLPDILGWISGIRRTLYAVDLY